jgi:F-box-like
MTNSHYCNTSQGTCQDTEPSPNLTINQLPDEVLLEIFDSYRHGINPYDYQWRQKHAWINLAHVCRKWRAVMFASYSRLDLGVSVGPKKPGYIKTILSGPLPIFVDYQSVYADVTGSALWRLRAALHHHPNRVRKIAFEGIKANLDKFFKLTNCTFPVLEDLSIQFRGPYDQKIPDTFLGGPDLSDSHLRHLGLFGVSLPSIFRFLLSATALTDLTLHFDDSPRGPSTDTALLACLKGMSCLRSLQLAFLSSSLLDTPSQPSTPKDIVTLSKLTFFRYIGHDTLFLDALVAGLSAPALRDVDIHQCARIWPPMVVHLPRFINEIEEHYRVVHVIIQTWVFHLSLLVQLGYIRHWMPGVKFGTISIRPPESIMRISSALSTRLATAEELHVTFEGASTDVWENLIPWRRFLQQFPCVKVLRTEGENNYCIARILLQGHEVPDDDVAFLPALEEIELEEIQEDSSSSQCEPELAALDAFISARQQAGCPVEVFFRN